MTLQQWIYRGIGFLGICFSSNLLAQTNCQTSLINIDADNMPVGYRQRVDIEYKVRCSGNWSAASLAIATFRGKRVSKPAVHLSGFHAYPLNNSGDKHDAASFPFTVYEDGVYVVRVEAMPKINPTFDDFDKSTAVEFYAFAKDGYVTYSLDSPEDARLKHNAEGENGRRAAENNIANIIGGTYVPTIEEEPSTHRQRHYSHEQQRQNEDDSRESTVKNRRRQQQNELQQRRDNED